MDFFEVGALVRLPARPDWGVGQIQTIVGDRITVNFEGAGKQVIVGGAERLELIRLDPLGRD